MEYTIIHNEAANRFETHIDDQIALVDYIPQPDNVLSVTHTEVPPSLEGRGIAAQLTKAILEYIKANGLKVRPICPYTKVYIERHPEYKSLLAE